MKRRHMQSRAGRRGPGRAYWFRDAEGRATRYHRGRTPLAVRETHGRAAAGGLVAALLAPLAALGRRGRRSP